jgi:alkylation response protein AidB-like acyl-CoA dehydrogenase
VPARYSFSLTEPPKSLPPAPMAGIPVLAMLALGVGAVPLGIARAAIDEFTAVARTKGDLAAKGWARSAVAEAESLRGSGLAYLLSEAAAVTSSAELRLAVATASRNAARAVDLMYDAAGGTALYMSSPLQRYRRDVHAATQHAMVGPDIRETIGAVLLGEDVNTARL